MRGDVDHFFHLAAIYDMTADAESAGDRQRRRDPACRRVGRRDRGGLLSPGQLDRRGRPLPGRMDARTCSIEAEKLDTNPYFRTKHESERLVREECARPWRVYRPGIVVGDSRSGAIEKIDGPYYFFKSLQRARRVLPSWLPTIGVEGGEINIVPVDFVSAAIDHIAHRRGLDGQAFHLTDPHPEAARAR